MSVNHLIHWTCTTCRNTFSPGKIQYTCPACGGNLDACYAYDQIQPLMTPDALGRNPDPTIWRYAPFYPNTLDAPP